MDSQAAASAAVAAAVSSGFWAARQSWEVIRKMRLSLLQRLAERFLCLVMLVTVSLVKLVRALANHVRTHGHALATVLSRPFFRDGKQPRARSGASLSFCHYKSIHFRPNLHFKQRLPAHMQPTDDSILS